MERLGGKPHEVLFIPGRPSLEGTFVVPPGHYFMMGDNRDVSQDSRYFGAVPRGRTEELPGKDGPVALILGNEITGVRSETLELCDGALQIPMFGVKHSLNVAVAFGIGVWELVKRARENL